MLGEGSQVTVDLTVGVGKGTVPGEVLDLVDVIAAQAACIHLLKPHHIELLEELGDAGQVDQALRVGQHMLPTVGYIVAVLAGIDPALDVVAQQFDLLHGSDDRRLPTEAGVRGRKLPQGARDGKRGRRK